MSEYFIPSESISHHEEIKKSTFIVHLAHTQPSKMLKRLLSRLMTRILMHGTIVGHTSQGHQVAAMC